QRRTGGAFDRGHFVAPTIAVLPLTSSLFLDELFVPLLAVGEVAGLDEAIAEANKAEYGLTAGIFSKKPEEIERFFDEIEAGVCYVNKRTGATTGAWPGAQPFTGWKGSGSTGKGGCGPYYVAQFMREQSRTVIEACPRPRATIPASPSRRPGPRPGRSWRGTTATRRPRCRRSIRSWSPAASAPWSRTWTATATSTSWRGSRSPRPDMVTPRS